MRVTNPPATRDDLIRLQTEPNSLREEPIAA